ncbi:hypothetical protein BHE74_00029695 [Ensete ventricosum]|nr:hypothetical protein BHE74_00029695 [Ensete ventricosum]
MGTEPAPTDSTNHLASGFYPLTLFADFYASALATHLVSGGSAGPHLVDQSSLERPTGEPRAELFCFKFTNEEEMVKRVLIEGPRYVRGRALNSNCMLGSILYNVAKLEGKLLKLDNF